MRLWESVKKLLHHTLLHGTGLFKCDLLANFLAIYIGLCLINDAPNTITIIFTLDTQVPVMLVVYRYNVYTISGYTWAILYECFLLDYKYFSQFEYREYQQYEYEDSKYSFRCLLWLWISDKSHNNIVRWVHVVVYYHHITTSLVEQFRSGIFICKANDRRGLMLKVDL